VLGFADADVVGGPQTEVVGGGVPFRFWAALCRLRRVGDRCGGEGGRGLSGVCARCWGGWPCKAVCADMGCGRAVFVGRLAATTRHFSDFRCLMRGGAWSGGDALLREEGEWKS